MVAKIDDDIMQQAIDNIGINVRYWVIDNSCQDWAGQVRWEYNRIKNLLADFC